MKSFDCTRYYQPALASVAISLLGLSLAPLAHGVETITGGSEPESWAMAIGIDMVMVALELAALAGVRTMWVTGLIAATCILSAGLNVSGFLIHAHDALGQVLAVALGVFVPAAVYGLIDTLTRNPQHFVR